jgi:hypothetical protein
LSVRTVSAAFTHNSAKKDDSAPIILDDMLVLAAVRSRSSRSYSMYACMCELLMLMMVVMEEEGDNNKLMDSSMVRDILNYPSTYLHIDSSTHLH